MKILKLILLLSLFYSCKKNESFSELNENQLLSVISDFENKYKIIKKDSSLPFNSYELGFFKLKSDTIIYIQRNEAIYYSNYSNFLFKDFKNNEFNDEFKLKTKLKYIGSFKTKKNNYVNVYSSNIILSILIKDDFLKKIDLNFFSIKNYGEDAIVEFNEPKYKLHRFKNNKITPF